MNLEAMWAAEMAAEVAAEVADAVDWIKRSEEQE